MMGESETESGRLALTAPRLVPSMLQFPATDSFSATTSVAALLLAAFISTKFLTSSRRRRIQKDEERVLVIGGSR